MQCMAVTIFFGLWVTWGFCAALGGVTLVVGAPSEVAGGSRVLGVSALAFWVDGAALANMLVSCLSAATFLPWATQTVW